jgi:hypothetical protein
MKRVGVLWLARLSLLPTYSSQGVSRFQVWTIQKN